MKFKLTKKEKNAISCLKRLAKRWPEKLWLFSGTGNRTLYVMRYDNNGKPYMTSNGGVDQDYIVDEIRGILNDGGDW